VDDAVAARESTVLFGVSRAGHFFLAADTLLPDASLAEAGPLYPLGDTGVYVAALHDGIEPSPSVGLHRGAHLVVFDETGERCETQVDDWVMASFSEVDPWWEGEATRPEEELPMDVRPFARLSGCASLRSEGWLWGTPASMAPAVVSRVVDIPRGSPIPELVKLAAARLDEIGWRAGSMSGGGWADGTPADVDVMTTLRVFPDGRLAATVEIIAVGEACSELTEVADLLLTPVDAGFRVHVLRPFSAAEAGVFAGAFDLEGDGRLELLYMVEGALQLRRLSGNAWQVTADSGVLAEPHYSCCC